MNEDLNMISKPSSKQKAETKEKKEEVPINLLPAHPSEKDFTDSYSVSQLHKM